MTLFDECIQSLGKETRILSSKQTEELFNQLVFCFPVTSWGRIDWSKIGDYHRITDVSEALIILNSHYGGEFSEEVFLLWNYTDAPGVLTDLKKVLENIDDVTAVGSDTWVYCQYSGYVIEFFHEGEVVLGFKNLQN
jgi:hypothetical protein